MSGTLHGPERGSEFRGGGDRQVAHPAAADVGGIGTVDPVAAGQQFRGVHRRRRRRWRRPARAGARRSAARESAAIAWRPRPGSGRAPRPRRRPASARPSAAPAPAAACAPVSVCVGRLAGTGRPVGATRCPAVSSASAIDDAPDGVAPSVGSAGRTNSCSASSAVSNQRPDGPGRRSAPAPCRAARWRPSARPPRR